MKKKQINSLIRLSKQAEKECKVYMPNLAGACYDKNKNRTGISNGYWGIWVDGFVDGLKMRDKEGDYIQFENIMGERSDYLPADIDYDELKQKAKTYDKVDENTCVKIGDKLFNPKYVKNIIDCFDDYNISVRSDFPSMLIESDGITAIICGMREVK